MPVHVTLGRLDADRTFAVSRFAIPELSDLPAMSLVAEALKRAIDERNGHLVLGPKGVGKSLALQAAVEQFEVEDQHLLALHPEGHRPRRLLVVRSVKARRPRDVLLYLLKAALPPGAVFKDRRGGVRRTDDELRDELVALLLKYRIVAVVVDEAELLSAAALRELRTLMSKAQLADPERRGERGDPRGDAAAVTGPNGGTRVIRAAGVGVVLVGTEAVRRAVLATDEAGGRWASELRVAPLSPDQVADLYPRLFPGFATHIARVGRQAWKQFVADHVTKGRALPMRAVENHARRYFACLFDAYHEDGRTLPPSDAVPFEESIFLYALTVTDFAVGLTPLGGPRRRGA